MPTIIWRFWSIWGSWAVVLCLLVGMSLVWLFMLGLIPQGWISLNPWVCLHVSIYLCFFKILYARLIIGAYPVRACWLRLLYLNLILIIHLDFMTKSCSFHTLVSHLICFPTLYMVRGERSLSWSSIGFFHGSMLWLLFA